MYLIPPWCNHDSSSVKCQTEMVSALFKMARIRTAKKRMAKKRQEPAQRELDLRKKTHGGARAGAGRPKKLSRKVPAHRARRVVKAYKPEHVVLRVVKGVPKLRQMRAYRAMRRVLVKCLGNDAFRVCHFSIQANHLHFIVEAKDTETLSGGMQRLAILASKSLNRELGRTGKMFAFRYHATQIANPKQARNSLAYVLNNWRHHREDEGCERARYEKLDPYASGYSFDGWSCGSFEQPVEFTPLPVSEPKTWLLRVGWKKHPRINPRETPGPMN
jgi:REP element-mobilizing transposase RayT